MIRHNNQAVVNSSSKYLAINRTTAIKCSSSSSDRTLPQPGLQHGPTSRPSVRDKLGLSLQNRGALSDRQTMHNHLKTYSGPISRARQARTGQRDIFVPSSGDQGIKLSFRTPSRKRSSYKFTLWLYLDSYQR
jgi:hypothetical protein